MKTNNQKNWGINTILIILVLISSILYLVLVGEDISNTAYKLTALTYSSKIENSDTIAGIVAHYIY